MQDNEKMKPEPLPIVFALMLNFGSKRFKSVRIWIPFVMRQKSVEEVDFDVRTYNCLSYHLDITSEHTLAKFHGITLGKLMGIKQFGRKSLVNFLITVRAECIDGDKFDEYEASQLAEMKKAIEAADQNGPLGEPGVPG